MQDNQMYKTIINLDERNVGALCLISYANDFSRLLFFTEKKRLKMICEMIESRTFENVLEIFKKHFGTHTEVYYKYNLI